jgi:hypothetical protein
MNTIVKSALSVCLGLMASFSAVANTTFGDTTRVFAVPLLTQTQKGNAALSWTEKDNAGTIHYYWSESKDQGKTFGDKKLIFASPGIGNSRLMRPKLFFKKDGSLVAVFGLRGEQAAPAPAPVKAEAAHNHDDHKPAAAAPAGKEGGKPAGGKGGGRPSDLQIVYTISKDNGNTWSKPEPVHKDRTPQTVRGFFDATVLPNGEIGVAYLNDIAGQKHQRDLRFVSSEGDTFGTEHIIDPFVCDCCNVSLLTDQNKKLNIYYRENENNTRDIATMTSSDNGKTFSKTKILFQDNWKINGCPHSGPSSAAYGSNNLITWFSGTENEPGIRVVTGQGKKLLVLSDPSAKNAFAVAANKSAVVLWEENKSTTDVPKTQVGYKHIKSDGNPATNWVKGSENGMNATGVVVGNKLVVAYEVKTEGAKTAMSVSTVDL